jgi:hypothetical protein
MAGADGRAAAPRRRRALLTLTYYTKGQNYSYINDTTFPPALASGTNLTNPDIVDQFASVTDVSGRKVSFLYDVQGLMSQMTDGPNTDASAGPRQLVLFRGSVTETSLGLGRPRQFDHDFWEGAVRLVREVNHGLPTLMCTRHDGYEGRELRPRRGVSL